MIIALLVGWIGYITCRVCFYYYSQRRWGNEKTLVYLHMGNQGDIAEWLLKKIFGIDGIRYGRLALAVEVDGAGDDTKKIVEIFLFKKGFARVSPSQAQEIKSQSPAVRYYDVRGLSSRKLLESYLNSIGSL